MKYTSLLERLGIEKRSAEIYLFLLDAGPSSVAKIAQSLDYHRAEVYHALPLLLEDNMVVKISK